LTLVDESASVIGSDGTDYTDAFPREDENGQAELPPGANAQKWIHRDGLVLPRQVPPTHLQRVRRRWIRRLSFSAIATAVLGGIALTALDVQSRLVHRTDAAAMLPGLPPRPASVVTSPAAQSLTPNATAPTPIVTPPT